MKIKVAILALLATACCGFAQTNPIPDNLCTAKGYTVVYFNGMRSTPKQSSNELDQLENLIGAKWKSEPVKFENFYDPTHGSALDIAEVYTQHAAEMNTEFSKRWEYFCSI